MVDILGGITGALAGATGSEKGWEGLEKWRQKRKKKREEEEAQAASGPAAETYGRMPKMRKGGKVKKTAPHVLHKGERVLTKAQARKYHRKRGAK